MATVNDVYEYMLFAGRKNQSGGISKTDFERSYNMAQRQYYDTLAGRFQQYQYGRAIPRSGLAQTESISAKLAPFIISTQINKVGNVFPKPPNYIRLVAMRYNDVSVTPNVAHRVRRVEHDKLYSATNSVLAPPSFSEPIYSEYASNFIVLPNAVSVVSVEYLRSVTDVVWGFTLDPQNRRVYDPATSTDPIWDDQSAYEIAGKALKILGISLKDGELANAGEQVNIKGE